MSNPHPTTVVVPLYGDLPSAERCIRSVLEHVDLSFHQLLVVNDIGPEADAMEQMVLGLLADAPGTRYVRNPKNLGFVGTCNRAALELDTSGNDVLLLNSDAVLYDGTLDEMSRVLHLVEKHGIVTARGDNATIASIPGRTADGRPPTLQRSRAVFDALNADLPRYTIAPVAHGFCFLVRRLLIDNYGLFDEAFAPGYGEENDFCLRVNGLGYSSVIANRAFASHEGSKSFSTPQQRQIQHDHEALLNQRYPYYRSASRHFDEYGIDVVDWFADFLVPADRPKKVLIDLHHLSLIYNGTVRNALTFLMHLQQQHERGALEGIEFTIASSMDAIDFFDLAQYGFTVRSNVEIADRVELFDLGFALAPLSAGGQIQRFDRHCLRWVISHLDIIALRILHLWEEEYARAQVVVDSLTWADRVIAISQAALDDTLERFPALAQTLPERTAVIHEGVAHEALTSESEPLAHHSDLARRQDRVIQAGGYALLVGNNFRHKQVARTVRALAATDRTVLAFGGIIDEPPANVIPIEGGYLSDQDVARLYDNAGVIVFPSAYEGFGLPVAEAALHNKPVIQFDSAVAREVAAVVGLGENAHFFSEFRELPALVEAVLDAPATRHPGELRTITDYNAGILAVLREVLDEPPSIERVRARRLHFQAIGAYEEGLRQRAHKAEAELNRRSVRLLVTMLKSRVVRVGMRGARRVVRAARSALPSRRHTA